MQKTRRIAFCGIMTALAMVLGYLEHLVPFSIGIYGVKLGLANLSVLCLLYLTDLKSALAVHAVRIFATGILFGNGVSLIYSAAGGFVSFFVMALLKRWGKFSAIGISVCGGASHNLAQLVAAIFLVDQLRIVFYLPVLMLSGVIAGLVVGLCSLPILRNRALQNWCKSPSLNHTKEKCNVLSVCNCFLSLALILAKQKAEICPCCA